MNENNYFRFSPVSLVFPLLAILSIWTVFWAELQFGFNLNQHGIYPRKLSGLQGVLFSPFIHGSVEHLYNNTIPLATLTLSVCYFYRNSALRIIVLGVLLSGFLTWLIGRPSYHIGASGLIYVLASFIFFKGVFTKYYRLIALSLAIVFIYGSMLWYIFPVKDGISWEGHLAGFLVGLVLAKFSKTKIPSPKKYAWEKEDFNPDEDAFLRHFDEDGNFIENLNQNNSEEATIIYQYKKADEKE